MKMLFKLRIGLQLLIAKLNCSLDSGLQSRTLFVADARVMFGAAALLSHTDQAAVLLQDLRPGCFRYFIALTGWRIVIVSTILI